MRLFPSLVFLAGVFAALLLACSNPEPTLEQRAQRLDKQLICPVCPGETLDQSNVQIAKDMRVLIRERLAQGQSEDEIKGYFVERYGTRILAEPPTSGVSLAVWIIPPVAMIAGAAALYFVVLEMRHRRRGHVPPPGTTGPASEPHGAGRASTTSGTADASDADLKPYLDAVDEELRRGKAGNG